MDECWGEEDLVVVVGCTGGAMVEVLPDVDASVVLVLEPAAAMVMN